MAVFSRRALTTTFIQVGVFFLICYFITLLLPGRATDNATSNFDQETVRTSTRCTDCIVSDVKYEKSGGDSSPIQHSRPIRAGDSVSNAVTETHDSVHDRLTTLQPLGNKSHGRSKTGGSHHKLHSTEPTCKDPLCTEYLTKEDKKRFDSCLQKVQSYKGQPQDGQCHFMPQAHRMPVALASYPGSGNTWLRGLLETATGICTGFEFCDISMRVKGFAGENIVSGAVSVVKTHGFPHWKVKRKTSGVHFDSAIVLVRNPLDAFVAEWNRRVANNFRGSTVSLTSHVKSAGKEMFGTNSKWVEFLQEQIPRWQAMMKEWVTSHGRHTILPIKYEDLKRNSTLQVKRILAFLQIPYENEDIDRRLTESFNSFHRTHKPEFDHFTPGQRQRVLRAIKDTIQLLNTSRLSYLLDLNEYL